ncbi:hypothetical protein GV794_13120 [Nocardia cyriacigeorgica]|uniref:Uncharacterized protein n=1 Tax=Nocardia cyriacigeorgica TaxID=135487 RepID=A0A6P1D362_9NOCA|nr:hypothetical protein [Nocardia cyriacigeorgica]NEW40134.1 hypothetical protein [Nocardia cyriacigeorgica]NEW43393.1 hypothetical protein [Nocardia cyriacigeorgica]NEW51540.1 hypothetical protein [Nocardia cyriacigeorgica]NEW56587.1 hypothetical protein [Nocardia cyriacigeorgica]
MRNRVRVGLIAGVVLIAPLAAAVPASAIPLEPAAPAAPELSDTVGKACLDPSAGLLCYLSTMSASAAGS